RTPGRAARDRGRRTGRRARAARSPGDGASMTRRMSDDAVGDGLEVVGAGQPAEIEFLAVGEKCRRPVHQALIAFLPAELDALGVAACYHARVVGVEIDAGALSEAAEQVRRILAGLCPLVMIEQLIMHL